MAVLPHRLNGNTVIIGEAGDNSFTGGALVFTRSNGAWSQQGGELVGSGSVPSQNSVFQGTSVALSADGNTALVGGPFDGGDVRGAVWVTTGTEEATLPNGFRVQ